MSCKNCGKKLWTKKRKLCRTCYNREIYNQKLKIKRAQAWLRKPISDEDKRKIILLLLRFKYFNYTAIDILLLTHYYYEYKKDESPDFDNYGVDKVVPKLCKMFKNVILIK